MYVGADRKLFFLQNTWVHSRTLFIVYIEVMKKFQNNVNFHNVYKTFYKHSYILLNVVM